MKARYLAGALCVVLLTGCASTSALNRAMSYPSKPAQVKMADDTYRVFEHETDHTIMTTTSLGSAMGVGLAKGLTLGLAEPYTPEQRHEAAARQYLDQTGRENCKIVSGCLLAEPQYEFTYECE